MRQPRSSLVRVTHSDVHTRSGRAAAIWTTDTGPPSTANRLSLQPFPEPIQIRRAEGAVVQAVAGAATLAPDHAAMIGAHRARKAGIAQRTEDTTHVDVAERGGMRHLVEAPLTSAADVAAVREV